MVDSIASSSTSKLSNCLAVADVSGSMGYFAGGHSDKKHPQPIHVCIALTLLLGELSAAPWNGSFLTFSTEPSIEHIDTSLPLSQRASTLSRALWAGSTNFYKVFDLILDTAKRNKLATDQMIERLFVFSDMQFDEASAYQPYGATEYQKIKAKFAEAGYVIPELVFWDLAAGRMDGEQPTNHPAQADERGVAMMSGFSGAAMKYFLRGTIPQASQEDEWEEVEDGASGSTKVVKSQDEEATRKNAHEHMMAVIGAECFKNVVVVD